MAKRATTKPETRWVKYMGPYRRVSVPLKPKQYVNRGEPIEVPADVLLCVHWRDADSPKTEAPAKDGER